MEADPFADDALGLWPASAPRYGSVDKRHPQPVASLLDSILSRNGASGNLGAIQFASVSRMIERDRRSPLHG